VLQHTTAEAALLHSGQALIAFLAPLTDREGVQRLADAGVYGFALESVPRITRAQPMDALSSQATVAGYKAALVAADRLPRFFPMLMTAAGTIPPAKVLVLGVGVAGLQALATAKRLGARTTGYDVRPPVREQGEALGAPFLVLGIQGEETEGGSARELTPEQQAAQQAELQARIPAFDVVITTAAVPGRQAPKLISAEAVRGMREGSVIVDLAGETCGNCELTRRARSSSRRGSRSLARPTCGRRWRRTPLSCSRATWRSCSNCWCATASSCSTGTTRSSPAHASRARRWLHEA
jgi:NAD(P) transhydrogenase subunit alpha